MEKIHSIWNSKIDFYEEIVFACFLLWAISEIILSHRRKLKRKVNDITDWTVIVQIVAIVITSAFGLGLELFSEGKCCGIFSYGTNLFMLILTCSLLIIGIIIRWRAIAQLKQWFSTTIGIQ